VVPDAEIYRLAGNQQPTKARKRPCISELPWPFGDIGGDGPIVREFAQLAEAEGYDGLTLADHVLGGNPANPASGRAGGLGLFHDPFVAFGFIAACTKKVELSTQVLIFAQRQTVLVAKQAASLDVLSGGRFRFGIGVGWNEMEFVGLNENFHNRGKRSEEQVQVMKALWADPYITFEGKWHRLPDAGINPRPPRRKIPLWFGAGARKSASGRRRASRMSRCTTPSPASTSAWPAGA
jgi:probable F420-dependent oxidoreductase